MDDELVDLNDFDFSMAPEAKTKAAVISVVVGAVVGVITYSITRLTAESSMQAIKDLMSGMFDIKRKEEDDG